MTRRVNAEATLARHLAIVEERLVAEFDDELPAEAIRQTVHEEIRRYDSAPVKQFIPVLVRRAAREQLKRRRHTDRRAG